MATHWDSISQVTKRIALVARGFSSYGWAYGRTDALNHLTLINFIVHSILCSSNQPYKYNFDLHIVSMPEGNAFSYLSLAWCFWVSMVSRKSLSQSWGTDKMCRSCLWGRRSVIAWCLHSKTGSLGRPPGEEMADSRPAGPHFPLSEHRVSQTIEATKSQVLNQLLCTAGLTGRTSLKEPRALLKFYLLHLTWRLVCALIKLVLLTKENKIEARDLISCCGILIPFANGFWGLWILGRALILK